MFDIAYTLFFLTLVVEVLVFLFLNMPTPRGWKSVIIRFLNTHPKVKTIMRAHLGFCLLAGMFYLDCYNKEARYHQEKNKVKAENDNYGSQLKYHYLSLKVLKEQRNKYITSMMIYAALALNAYITILNYMYEKRQIVQAKTKLREEGKQQVKSEAKEMAKG